MEARERPVNGNEVRDARFLTGDGYDAAQVDDLLRRVAVELDAGRPAGPLIAGATFPRRARSRGYDIGAVDWFLDQLRRREDASQARMSADPSRDLAVVNHFTRSGPGDLAERTAAPSRQALRQYRTQDRKYLAEECAGAWHDLGQQPAPHQRWVRTGTARRELRTADQTIAARHGWDISANITISTGGRALTLKRATASSGPRIAEIAVRNAQDLNGHFLRRTSLPRWFPGARRIEASLAQGPPQAPLRELVDEAGIPIMYTSGLHLHEQAGACITFDEQRWLRFPVRGTQRTNAIMTAVDQAGTKIARYRLIGGKHRWKRVEITVHAGQLLTDELVLAIALSAPWLSSYFSHPPEGH
jgi:DivIVA domain-containing protein